MLAGVGKYDHRTTAEREMTTGIKAPENFLSRGFWPWVGWVTGNDNISLSRLRGPYTYSDETALLQHMAVCHLHPLPGPLKCLQDRCTLPPISLRISLYHHPVYEPCV